MYKIILSNNKWKRKIINGLEWQGRLWLAVKMEKRNWLYPSTWNNLKKTKYIKQQLAKYNILGDRRAASLKVPLFTALRELPGLSRDRGNLQKAWCFPRVEEVEMRVGRDQGNQESQDREPEGRVLNRKRTQSIAEGPLWARWYLWWVWGGKTNSRRWSSYSRPGKEASVRIRCPGAWCSHRVQNDASFHQTGKPQDL